MIYISTACVRHNRIKNSIIELVDNGFYNIELSGGSNYYDGLEEDLLELKDKFNLNYICHNYFPPPKDNFVINLGSLDDEVFIKTYNHLEKSINLSRKLGTNKFGFHAGFYLNVPINQIGKEISKSDLFNKSQSMTKFCDAFTKLKEENSDIDLYIENNVVSYENYQNFRDNVFMLTCKGEYVDMRKIIDYKFILDVAHLKVSCNTLNLNFENQFDFLFHKSDYIHISDNNSYSDQNKALSRDSDLYNQLKKYSFKSKTITIEVYDSMKEINKTFNLIKNL